MGVGARAESGYGLSDADPRVEAATAEVRRLQARQRDLPDVMREAAAAGLLEAVTRLRAEWDSIPAKLWAAEYTAVQAELNAPRRPGSAHPHRPELLERARELAMEVRPGLAKPTMTPGVR